ncbi:MAG: hypothetical protein RL662_2023 [Bacteroidota bacterium]|jgi:Flp pilus assembly protein TadD
MENKIRILTKSIIIVLFVVFLASCGSKMKPLSASLFTATPTPLELKGSKIPVTINGKFPEKWFDKNAEVTITPILKLEGKEVWGNSTTYQGENVSSNGIVISQQHGDAFTLKSEFDYDPTLTNPELFLRFTSKIKNKNVTLPDLKLSEGLLTTATLADVFTTNPAIAPNGFKKVIKESYDANILFLIQQAELRSSELNSSNLDAWENLVKSANDNSKQNVNVEVVAYASPDGGYELNEKLAEKREKNTTTYLNNEFDKENVGANVYANYTAQDWDGFKKLIEASSLQDKDLVLRVLSMYNDPLEREREIKNISAIYKDIAETILPQLRRSRLVANIETIGKSDQELKQALNGNTVNLSADELLHTAELEGVSAERAYKLVTQKYPNDYRGWNNLGAYYFSNGLQEAAKQAFAKAQHLKPDAAEANMNLGLFAIDNGEIAKAEQLIGGASEANTINEALGLLYLKKGDANIAAQVFGNTVSNNAALAQLLSKQYSEAQKTLDQLEYKDATTYYLLAVVAARTNNVSAVTSNLQKAFINNPSFKRYASTDIEFAKFKKNESIGNLLK